MPQQATILIMADTVVSVLNGATLSFPFTAERWYVPVRDLKDMAGMNEPLVSVVPTKIDGEILNRAGAYMETYLVAVGVQMVIGQGAMTNAQILAATDPLMYLVEEIVDLLVVTTIPSDPLAKCTDYTNEPIYAPAHLDEKRLFTSVLTFTFKLGR